MEKNVIKNVFINYDSDRSVEVLMNDGKTEMLGVKADFPFIPDSIIGLSTEEASKILTDLRNETRKISYDRAAVYGINTNILDDIPTNFLSTSISCLRDHENEIKKYMTSQYFNSRKIYAIRTALDLGLDISKYIDKYDYHTLNCIITLLANNKDPKDYIDKYDVRALDDIVEAEEILEFYKNFDKNDPHYYDEDDGEYFN